MRARSKKVILSELTKIAGEIDWGTVAEQIANSWVEFTTPLDDTEEDLGKVIDAMDIEEDVIDSVHATLIPAVKRKLEEKGWQVD